MDARVFEVRTTPWATVEASIGSQAGQVIIHANAVSVKTSWSPPEVEAQTQVQDARGVVPDIYAPRGYLLVSPAALAAPTVRRMLDATGELLPVARFDATDDDPDAWAVYHCTAIADVLDYESSDIKRFADGRIMRVASGVLRDFDSAEVPPVFRQQGVAGSLLFTATGRRVIEDANVVGPEFAPAFQGWSPTAGSDVVLTVDEIGALPPSRLDDRVWLRLCHLVDLSDPAALRAEDPDVSAYLATRLFEWEVMNGGLHQYFFNYPDPDLLTVVLDGYDRLGVHGVRTSIERTVAPIAAREAEWRDSLRNGRIETFFGSYGETDLDALDQSIESFDHRRVELVRSLPEKFAR